MVAYPEIPRTLFKRCPAAEWNLTANPINPGRTASGSLPVMRIDGGGLWVANFHDLFFRTLDEVRTFKAIRLAANNGVMPIVVPRRDPFSPFPTSVHSYDPIPHSDGSFFSDGTGYSQSVISVESVGNAALRATELVLNLINCAALSAGMTFSIRHPTENWRLYEITSTSIGSPPFTTISFFPPLREAVSEGTEIEFDNPRCLMRLANQAAMNFRMSAFPYSPQSAAFVEAFAA